MTAALSDVQIAACFNSGLGQRFTVRLLGGAEEPVYEPGSDGAPAVIRYTRDYAPSALHELAHWCIAGARRRLLPDYGYWYRPPPRSNAEQRAFFRVELPVQALEARLALAAGVPFRVSVDDLERPETESSRAAKSRFEAQVLGLAGLTGDNAVSASPIGGRRAETLQADLARYRLRVAA